MNANPENPPSAGPPAGEGARLKVTLEEANQAPMPESVLKVSVPAGGAVAAKPRSRWPWVLGLGCGFAFLLIVLGTGGVVYTVFYLDEEEVAPANAQKAETFRLLPKMPAGEGKPMGEGIPKAMLALASPQVYGGWVSAKWDTKEPEGSLGSTAVFEKQGNKLLLATNAHCLGLRDSAARKLVRLGSKSIYELYVLFPGEQRRKVLRFAHNAADLDLAVLEVDGTGLVEGVNYVVLPHLDAVASVEAGDAVVAVGSPHGLFATQTFGRISAIRSEILSKIKCTTLQIDAAINPGNSGGPLLLEKAGKFWWVGINSAVLLDQENGGMAQGLGFAIHVGEFFDSTYRWYTCDSAGAKAAAAQNKPVAGE
jgi:S1-C subfamily serine protease